MSNNPTYAQQPQYQPPPQPGHSAPYAQGYPYPPQGDGDGSKGGGAPVAPQWYNEKNEEYGTVMQPKKRKFNDLIFLVLFLLTVAGFTVVSALALWSYARQGDANHAGVGGGTATGSTLTLNSHTIYLMLLITAFALVLTFGFLVLLRAFPRQILHITLILTILYTLGVAIWYFTQGYYSGAIVFALFFVIFCFAYFGYRARIPLAAKFIEVVVDIAKHHKAGVYGTAIISMLLQASLGVWLVFTIVGTYARWGNQQCQSSSNTGTGNRQTQPCSTATVTGLIVFETFAYLWMSQVTANVALATLAGGPFGSWYYFGPKGAGMPPHPTRSAFVRASTLSLGSIAFGSLIVAILELIRMILNYARASAAADGNFVGACLAACAACFLGLIESLVEYFNRYAYIEIALYGKPYLVAAKDTWKLFVDRGIDALVNDQIVSMGMTWGSFFIGGLCVLFSFVYLKVTNPSYNSGGGYTPVVLLFSFLIGFQIAQSLTSTIEAGVSTIFVGLAEDPHVLQQRNPALFDIIAAAYPQVTLGVHGSV